jgi:hypothetical protein
MVWKTWKRQSKFIVITLDCQTRKGLCECKKRRKVQTLNHGLKKLLVNALIIQDTSKLECSALQRKQSSYMGQYDWVFLRCLEARQFTKTNKQSPNSYHSIINHWPHGLFPMRSLWFRLDMVIPT